jgi:hypothetical protein
MKYSKLTKEESVSNGSSREQPDIPFSSTLDSRSFLSLSSPDKYSRQVLGKIYDASDANRIGPMFLSLVKMLDVCLYTAEKSLEVDLLILLLISEY